MDQDLRDALRPFLHGKRHALYDPAENSTGQWMIRGRGHGFFMFLHLSSIFY